MTTSRPFIDDEQIDRNIEKIRTYIRETNSPNDLSALVIQFSSTSFSPARAFNNFERFLGEIRGRPDIYEFLRTNTGSLRTLACLFSGSQYLSDILVKHPDYLRWVMDPVNLERSRFKDNMQDDLERFISRGESEQEKIRLLKRFKNREYIRLGLRDLMKTADTVETLEDISAVADVICQKAYDRAYEVLVKKFGRPLFSDNGQATLCEFTVLGLGKLGGRELNFSSDIDLIYIYSTDQGKTEGRADGAGQISTREFFSFLARDITKILNEVTEDGRLYRVDLDLRPEGKSGNIASSLRSLEVYYESWGETWERQMLIKARPVAGSQRLAREFKNLIKPFVYRKYLDFSALKEIKAMKDKINIHLSGKRAKGRYDVKLGAGGIREAEFIIQSFQLVYGGKTSWFRKPNSMRTLHRISEKGLLSYNEYSSISSGYFFLRDLENRLQMCGGLQVHHIPENFQEQVVLAKKMGFTGETHEQLVGNMFEEYKKHTEKIHAIYNELLSSGNYDSDSPDAPGRKISIDDYEKTLERLRESGFRDLKGGYKSLVLLRDGTVFAHPTIRTKERFESILPMLLEEMSRLPEPDLSLKNFESFIDSGRVRDMVYMVLSQNRLLIRVLCSLFGFSRFLSTILIQQPELLDYLIDVSAVLKKRERDVLLADFTCVLDEAVSYEASLDCIRKHKRVEELCIGINEIIKKPHLEETFSRVSVLADIYLEKSLLLVEKELCMKYGKPQSPAGGTGFAVIGLGKLGGNELNYGSDLDLVFVYSGSGETTGGEDGQLDNFLFYTKLCQKFIQAVVANTRYGFGYRVDTRLRPEGEKGLMIMSLGGYCQYYKKRGSIWERQALIKSRFIAGDSILGTEFVSLAHKVAFETPLDGAAGKMIYEMRKKIELGSGKEYDFKIGRGGVVDIEFSTQYLQMKWGSRYPSLRVPQTLVALRELRKYPVANPKDIDALINGYTFLRQIELKIRIDQDRPVNRLPANRAELEGLVKRLGKRGEKVVQPFLSEFESITTRVRDAYENIFSI